jgi:alpha-1,2-mannosyltransferase
MATALASFIGVLRSGDWLTRERMRVAALAVLLFTVLALGFLSVTAKGSVDILGRPLGTDFSSFYAAGSAVLDGQPTAPYDPALQHAREQALFGPTTPFYSWQYPPFFLLLASALALVPYSLALLIWQGGTLLLYLLAIRAVVRGGATDRTNDSLWLLLALGFPAVFVNLGHGQNGFLSAALLGGALVQLDRRPFLAGILFGLLAYKPQLGLMIPLALVATGRWRTIAAAGATVGALALAVTAVFGIDIWPAFLESTRFTRTALLETGDPGWEKIQTVFAWARMWGGSIDLAYAAQGAATVSIAAGLVWLWRKNDARFSLKASGLAIATVVGTPFSLDYDMMVLAVAIAFLAADGLDRSFAPYEKTAIAALWLAPLVARGIGGAVHVPIGTITMVAVFAFVTLMDPITRVRKRRSATAASSGSGRPRNNAR